MELDHGPYVPYFIYSSISLPSNRQDQGLPNEWPEKHLLYCSLSKYYEIPAALKCVYYLVHAFLYIFLYRGLRKKLKREQIVLHNGCESDSEYGTTLRGNGEIAERTTTNNAMAFSLRCLPNPVLLSPLPL